MDPIATPPRRRIVLTGGPGAGKTAALELARRALPAGVRVLPEAATIVFGGGFPRDRRESAVCAEQRAIFHVQTELERMMEDRDDVAFVLCDRGTLDGLAYWPRSRDAFFRELATDHATQLARYDLVLHLRTPTNENGYHGNGLRIESAAEAARIDGLIEEAWRGHPRRVFVESTPDFLDKAMRVLDLLRWELGGGAQALRAGASPAWDAGG